MTATILDGKATALLVRREVKAEVASLLERGITPRLMVVLVGDDPASAIYVRSKGRAAARVGIAGESVRLPGDTSEAALLALVAGFNADPSVHGILVQLPLPKQIDPDRIILSIDPDKDVDGLHPLNAGRLMTGRPGPVPCTPAGVMRLLDEAEVPLHGKRAVVIGRSHLVGKPIAQLLLARHATVTTCHSRTPDLGAETRRADVLVVAAGKPRLIAGEHIRPGAAVVDVGIHRLDDGSLCGDVDFSTASEVAGWISPVPGGVGPMTIALLLSNTARAAAAAAERSPAV
jgi:methylenetetrahydrofolate dehydrogenase (NADP+)/methenyltetrahydrofolate cyclohydrolase